MTPPQQSAVKLKLNGALNALDSSPDGTHAIVAGREVLKVLSVNETEVTEALNIRVGSRLNLNFSSNDVQWLTKQKIATAATNGAVVIWDLTRARQKLQERVISEHARAVNRICGGPPGSGLLLSASQDGTMRLWASHLTYKAKPAKLVLDGKSESVRDVQFNPVNIHELAAAFETGTIQKWDLRKPNIYERKLNAHYGLALTVDWHSDGRTLATGGRDKFIKVWDMKSDGRKPLHVIQTMTSVARVQWRPGREYEVASCALLSDYRIHVWDVRRPFLAKYYIEEHDNVATGFKWQDPGVIWSCSKDKHFMRHHVSAFHRPLDLITVTAHSWNAYNDIIFAAEDKSIENEVSHNTNIPTPTAAVAAYKSHQPAGIVNMPPFDYQAFCMMARQYSIASGEDIWASCARNARVAAQAGHGRTAQTWRVLQLLFSQPPQPPKPTQSITTTTTNSNNNNTNTNSNSMTGVPIRPSLSTLIQHQKDVERRGNTSQESHRSSSFIGSTGHYPQSLGIMAHLSYPDPDVVPWSESWNPQQMLLEILYYYGEQGDVQMCTTILLVLDQQLAIWPAIAKHWFTAYIELLHRFKLWSTASAVMNNCRLEEISSINQEATVIHTTCNNCFRPLNNPHGANWACDRCRRPVNPCSLCHQTVKGLYAWCQGCGHGGHLKHMYTWFQENLECPTGCGHVCTIETVITSIYIHTYIDHFINHYYDHDHHHHPNRKWYHK
ncbi:WD40-repeat-containing domain protein [Syncephalis fuscata]|nr:WD40-repeat-containing domain protein [Syncephalis fuscata]